jgi:hypothetical protein
VEGAGPRDVQTGLIDVEARHAGFDDCWVPISVGAGPLGGSLVARDAPSRAEIRDARFELLGRPAGAFTLSARASAIRGTTRAEACRPPRRMDAPGQRLRRRGQRARRRTRPPREP